MGTIPDALNLEYLYALPCALYFFFVKFEEPRHLYLCKDYIYLYVYVSMIQRHAFPFLFFKLNLIYECVYDVPFLFYKQMANSLVDKKKTENCIHNRICRV